MNLPHALIVGLGLVAVGCGSSAAPTSELQSASGAIRAAEEANGERDGKAALHLRFAKESLAQGQTFLDDEEMKSARQKFEQAQADAEVALATARLESTRDEAKRIHEYTRALQTEIQRDSAAN